MSPKHPFPPCSFPNLSIYALVNLNAPFENVFGESLATAAGVFWREEHKSCFESKGQKRGKLCFDTCLSLWVFCTLDGGP